MTQMQKGEDDVDINTSDTFLVRLLRLVHAN
jgi:hypothetical protein